MKIRSLTTKNKTLYYTFLVITLSFIGCTTPKLLVENEVNLDNLNLKPKLTEIPTEDLTPTDLSTLIVKKVTENQEIFKELKALEELNSDSLQAYLNTDLKKECFWINVYNAHSLFFLQQDPSTYLTNRSDFFEKKQIKVAHMIISLEEIEHGILRKGATIWTTGYIRIPFRNKLVRNFAVDKVDFKIHFALNCGAKSCPPIAVYYEGLMEQQLSEATEFHLSNQVEYSTEEQTAFVPAFMNWFRADFSGKKGIKTILTTLEIVPESENLTVNFSEYDWTMDLENITSY